MDIGREIRTITVEPITEPVPREIPAPATSPFRTPEPLPA
jgi:hypothetical protein